jgi:hypothetical protein
MAAATTAWVAGWVSRLPPSATPHHQETAVPTMGLPFLFVYCKSAKPDGTNINHELVKDGWCWWYRKYALENAELEKLESEAREAQRGL